MSMMRPYRLICTLSAAFTFAFVDVHWRPVFALALPSLPFSLPYLDTYSFTDPKPEDAQLMVSVREMQIWKIVDVGIGLTVLIIALARLGEQIGWQDALAFISVMIAGGTIVYSFWLILAATAFWLVRIDNVLYVFETLYQAGRWPVRIYPGWMQFMLTFLIPVAFAVTVPVEALTGRLTTETLALAMGLAVGLLIVSRLVWKFGLKHYSGASA